MNAVEAWTETLLGYPIDWASTASWVQAWGSILAIGASSVFAVATPLYVRDLDRRDATQCALDSLRLAGHHAEAIMNSLRDLAAGGEGDEHEAYLLINRRLMKLVKTQIDALNLEFFDSEAVQAIYCFTFLLDLFDEAFADAKAMTNLCRGSEGIRAAEQQFAVVVNGLKACSVARQHHTWRITAPENTINSLIERTLKDA